MEIEKCKHCGKTMPMSRTTGFEDICSTRCIIEYRHMLEWKLNAINEQASRAEYDTALAEDLRRVLGLAEDADVGVILHAVVDCVDMIQGLDIRKSYCHVHCGAWSENLGCFHGGTCNATKFYNWLQSQLPVTKERK